MEQERTYKWIQDRLRDLHLGTLSEGDRARLVELSREDPFLKDALEGYQTSVDHDHMSRLRTISHRIQTKNIAKRRKLLLSKPQWVVQAVAASLLLILVSWTVIYYLSGENTQVLVSTEIDNSVINDLTIEDSNKIANDIHADVAMEETVVDELNSDPPGLRANAQANQSKAEAKEESQYIGNDLSSQDATQAAEPGEVKPAVVYAQPGTITTTTKGDEEVVDQSMSDYRSKDAGAYANALPPSIEAQRVTGQVIDTYGQPVTGAFIAIPNSNLVSTSNVYGRFELFLPTHKSSVEITSTGYQDTLITFIQGQEDLIVVLSPEQMYTDALTKSQSAEQASTLSMSNQTNMFEYIRANSRFPIQLQFNSNEHAVTVEFNVSASGRPQNVKTVQSSVDKKFHLEAIRLIENGPSWHCEEYPCKKEYSIYFK